MNKFLNTFKLSALTRLNMEGFIFQRASELIEGYRGGQWKTKTVKGCPFTLIPGADSDRFTITTPFGKKAENVDRLTASVVVNFLAVMWFWEMVNNRLTEEQYDLFSAWRASAVDAVYAKGSKINSEVFRDLTD